MNANTEKSKAWREEQRNAGRTPRLVWLDAKEWAIVRGVIEALKKMRKTGDTKCGSKNVHIANMSFKGGKLVVSDATCLDCGSPSKAGGSDGEGVLQVGIQNDKDRPK